MTPRHPMTPQPARTARPDDRLQASEWPARLRFVGRSVAVTFAILWVGSFYPFDDLMDVRSLPLGADYAMLYVAGQTFQSGEADSLYDDGKNQARVHRLFPQLKPGAVWPYRYPPFVAAIMAPFTRLSYGVSWGAFVVLSAAAFGLSLGLLMRMGRCGELAWRSAFLWGAVGWPIAMETFAGGQLSAFGLLIVCGGLLMLRVERQVLAGAILALGIYKPNLVFLIALGCCLRYPRMLIGALPVIGLSLFASYAVIGHEGCLAYFNLASQLATQTWSLETPYWKVQGLTSWAERIAPGYSRPSLLLGGLSATGWIAWRWRMAESTDHRLSCLCLSSLLIVNSLTNPYLPIYDILLLLPAVVLLGESLTDVPSKVRPRDILGQWLMISLTGVLFAGPHVSQAIARATQVQLFPLALAMFVGCQLYLIATWPPHDELHSVALGGIADRDQRHQLVP